MQKTIKCKTLLGQRGLDFSIACLHSFITHSEDQILLEIYEDGSVTDEDEQKLLTSLPGSTVIRKTVRTPIIEQKLKNYPLCKKFRDENVLAQKLFDVSLYNDDDIFFIDSDIFFFQKYKLPDFNDTPTFMYDTQNAISFSPGNFFNFKQAVYPKINTGIIYFPHKLFSLDFLENLLKDKAFSNGLVTFKVWAEQTLWAIMASAGNKINYFNPQQIIMATENTVIANDTIAVHLVSSYRQQFEELRKFTPPVTQGYTQVSIKPAAKPINKVGFFTERLIKKVKNVGK
ncbi:hypothetical protein [Mucilaginibacter terrae]|uniref:Nucleotide-diphospho-sugar transferase domain-containing protein n=1 Tax=Mucilaginibacter terrae TaxID=1955052 RepID=A0ABU3GUP0_9SPHI|nr:hypothetical protein [Mucilaginibacter terrae]MDT3403493.1 hypothetical protein [Mucilaginibacter terrae]